MTNFSISKVSFSYVRSFPTPHLMSRKPTFILGKNAILNLFRRQKRPFLPQFYNLLFFGFFFLMTDPTTFYLFPYEKEQKSRQKMTVVTDEPLGNIVFRTFNSRQLTYNLKNHGIQTQGPSNKSRQEFPTKVRNEQYVSDCIQLSQKILSMNFMEESFDCNFFKSKELIKEKSKVFNCLTKLIPHKRKRLLLVFPRYKTPT